MDETLFKVAVVQGGAVAVLVVVAVIFVRHLLPLVRQAIAAHQSDMRELLAAHQRQVEQLIDAFREGLDRTERLVWQQLDDSDGRREAAAREGSPPPPPVPLRRQEPRPAAAEEPAPRRLRRITAPLVLLLGVLSAMPACTSALVRQVEMRRLSHLTAARCKAAPALCGALLRCQEAAHAAALALQNLNQAIAHGEDETAPAVVAAEAEAEAKVQCGQVGVR